jgi:predicted N-acetyltransferase YhbS
VIRSVQPGDHAAIGEILEAAFPALQEAALVCALRRDSDIVLELMSVAESVVGYVGFSRSVVTAISFSNSCPSRRAWSAMSGFPG